MCHDAGVLLAFIPPYSPEYKPYRGVVTKDLYTLSETCLLKSCYDDTQ